MVRRAGIRRDRIKKKVLQRPSSVKKQQKGKRKSSLSPSDWVGKMKGIPCFVIGNAPSINKIKDMSILDNYFTVGINRIFFKYDPTILIWQDLALWTQERKKVKKLHGWT